MTDPRHAHARPTRWTPDTPGRLAPQRPTSPPPQSGSWPFVLILQVRALLGPRSRSATASCAAPIWRSRHRLDGLVIPGGGVDHHEAHALLAARHTAPRVSSSAACPLYGSCAGTCWPIASRGLRRARPSCGIDMTAATPSADRWTPYEDPRPGASVAGRTDCCAPSSSGLPGWSECGPDVEIRYALRAGRAALGSVGADGGRIVAARQVSLLGPRPPGGRRRPPGPR